MAVNCIGQDSLLLIDPLKCLLTVRIPEPSLHELPCWISLGLPSYKTWDGKKSADFRHPWGQFTSSEELDLMWLRKRKWVHSRLIGFCWLLLLSPSLLWDTELLAFIIALLLSGWQKSCELHTFIDISWKGFAGFLNECILFLDIWMLNQTWTCCTALSWSWVQVLVRKTAWLFNRKVRHTFMLLDLL